jgi:hypothetical protein
VHSPIIINLLEENQFIFKREGYYYLNNKHNHIIRFISVNLKNHIYSTSINLDDYNDKLTQLFKNIHNE